MTLILFDKMKKANLPTSNDRLLSIKCYIHF